MSLSPGEPRTRHFPNPRGKELIVLLDDTDSPKLLDVALESKRVLSEKH